MANEKRQKLVHLHTGENRAPSASVLNYGEIAVMHNEAAPSLFIKAGEGVAERVAQFIDKVQTEALIDTKISASTQEMIALKSEVVTERGRIDSLQNAAVTAVTVNGVTAELAPSGEGLKTASVTVDTDDVKVGTAVTYSGETLVGTTATTTEALQALSDKIKNIDGVVSESNHGHENKAVLDGITAAKVENWDNAFASAHTHENKAVLDGITAEQVTAWDQAATDDHTHTNKALLDTYTQTEANLADAVAKKHEHANKAELDLIASGDKAKWDAAATALNDKVDKVEGKGLSTNDYTTAEKEKLAAIEADADVNVIETVKVNGTALTVTDKAVDILVAEGTANGTVKVNGTDVAVHGLGSAAYEDKTAFDASGAADTVKTELIGDMTGATKTLGGLEDRIDALTTGSNVTISTTATTENMLKSYTFSQNGSVIGTIDIPKDLVVTSGKIVEEEGVKYLRLTIANQSEPVDIAVSDLVDVYTQGNGIEVSAGNVISAKVVAGNGLSLDANGIAMAKASASADGAMSSSDFTKLAGIESGAQVNVLEGVQVNGADLTPDANKKVNVTVAAGTNNGTIAVNGSDVAVTGLKSAAFAETTDFDAAGAAAAASAAAITAVVGDMTGDTKTLGALQDAIEGLHLGEDNVLEGVQVNGTELAITSKKVNVTVAEGSANGTIAVNGSNVAVHGLGSAAYEDATTFEAAGNAGAAAQSALTRANAYTDAAVQAKNVSATGDTLVEASASNNAVTVGASTALTAAVANANSALQTVSKGTDGDYVTTTVGTKANNDQSIGVAVTVVDVTAATASNKGLAEASDVKAYVDGAVAGKNVSATGDTLVSATAANNTVTVAATQDLQDAVDAANASVQGIATNKDSGAVLDSDRKLDFTGFGIDCGEY